MKKTMPFILSRSSSHWSLARLLFFISWEVWQPFEGTCINVSVLLPLWLLPAGTNLHLFIMTEAYVESIHNRRNEPT